MAGLMVILFLAGTYLHRQDHRILILSGTALVPLLLFFRLGPGTERAYWGAAILPQIMIMATLTLSYPIKILQLEKDMYKQINPVSPGGQIPQENKEIIQ